MVNKHNIAELTIENADFKIKIKTANSQNGIIYNQPQVQPQITAPVVQAPQLAVEEKIQPVKTETPKSETPVSDKQITIKSPIVGTFYRSPGPDKDVFVKPGDEINVGSVLCIIEAMKLFNEIESEYSGKIIKILVDDKSPVEFDQPLFIIESK